MAKLLNKITRDTTVGIYDNCADVVRVYEDRLSIEVTEEEFEE